MFALAALLCSALSAAASSDFYVSTAGAPKNFDLSKLKTKSVGERDTFDFKIFYEYEGERISPWHQIPYIAGEAGGEMLLHFICEIPKGTTAKMEVNKENTFNPIIQDTKKGKLRYYKYMPEVGSLVNYGAIAQTWEHPDEPHPDTGVGGDNDPIDVLQLDSEPCKMGEVQAVRALGTFALIDDDETDWKVLVVRHDDETAGQLRDIGDVPEETKTALIEWFRKYKTAEGKGLNRFGLDEKVMDKAYALKICDETHEAWRKLHESWQKSQEL
eukprot:NODE_1440_length_1140_cov_580.600922.p1 GENE.NODE_1440_length_1140_cov_580.600922~~NODE_1440_length_1140_cov_580.600922.p1  ORF type:complete len:295 (+),score=123.38 NODE_1440_length_1140_cov_580.600922:70-885(+)